jgi:hypothetical protein
MQRRGDHITVTLVLALMLVLSSCSPRAAFHPVSLLMRAGSQSTVISTVLFRLPGKLIDATLTGMAAHFDQHQRRHQKEVRQSADGKGFSVPIHTRIANPIPLKKDRKNEKSTKPSTSHSPTNHGRGTKPENQHQPHQDAENQNAPVNRQLM